MPDPRQRLLGLFGPRPATGAHEPSRVPAGDGSPPAPPGRSSPRSPPAGPTSTGAPTPPTTTNATATNATTTNATTTNATTTNATTTNATTTNATTNAKATNVPRRAATEARAPEPLSPSELAERMRDRLDGLGELVVVGEVTGFRGRPGAHWYFELKDDRSRIGAAFFANANQRHRGPLPRDGDRVVVRGRATFYGPQGRAQLVVTSVEAFGDGDLQRQLEERRARLAAEGLFAAERKRALPLLPRRVGIVTSLQGAALHDVLKVMGGRAPGVDVVVAATRVQGAYASEVVGALQLLDARGGCDVVLVVRGGGAREDLAVFNEESVVRAVVGCSVPVVSGVGHETDVTLCDLAADVRAATPSQAAQFAVPDVAALVTRVTGLQRRLRTAAQAGVDRGARQLIVLERRLPAPAALVQKKARPLVLLEERLAQQSPVARLARQARTLDDLQRRLARQVPDVRGGAARLDDLARRLDEAARRRSDDAEARLRRAVDRLDALSPLAVLRRGWALATVDDRLARADDLVRGARLRLRIDGGDADVVVDTVRTPTERS